jgi:hypothetical protein
MAKAKYLTPEYRAERKAIDQAQAAGQWLWCNEIQCVHPSRDIAPWQPADVAHDVTGTRILGPAHRRCNRREGAARGNRARKRSPRRWVL